MITLKLPAWLWGIALICFLVLAFALFRGCENSKALAKNNNDLSKSHISDSIKMRQDSIDYNQSRDLLNGQIELKENKLAFTEFQLDSASKVIDKLLKRHTPVIQSDTTITTVPNEYISECEDCFTNLGLQQSLVNKYKDQIGVLKNDYVKKDKLNYDRIDQLTQSLNKINNDYNRQKEINEAQKKGFIPHWKFLFSMGVMSINSVMPNAAGIGGAYQDKRNRIFAFRYYASEYGSIKALDVYMPLSFKTK